MRHNLISKLSILNILIPEIIYLQTFSVSSTRYAPKFDEHARQLLSAGPYPVLVPPDGSVYDYCLDFSKGGLVRWEERPGAQLKTLPSSYTVVTEVTVLNHCYLYLIFIMNSKLKQPCGPERGHLAKKKGCLLAFVLFKSRM